MRKKIEREEEERGRNMKGRRRGKETEGAEESERMRGSGWNGAGRIKEERQEDGEDSVRKNSDNSEGKGKMKQKGR